MIQQYIYCRVVFIYLQLCESVMCWMIQIYKKIENESRTIPNELLFVLIKIDGKFFSTN